jgi:phosphatidylserine decarboxylase
MVTLLLIMLFVSYGSWNFVAASLALFAFFAFFFRDPDREIGEGIVSPSDGRIDYMESNRMEIFLGPLDCHVIRSPIEGVVERVVYKKGKFRPAFWRAEGNGENERNEIYIRNEKGLFKVVQIAGIFARRIICRVKEGDRVEKGERIGAIIFGSRVVLEVPEGVVFVKKTGDKIKAGETVAYEVG